MVFGERLGVRMPLDAYVSVCVCVVRQCVDKPIKENY